MIILIIAVPNAAHACLHELARLNRRDDDVNSINSHVDDAPVCRHAHLFFL
jgi:hypothetical protein